MPPIEGGRAADRLICERWRRSLSNPFLHSENGIDLLGLGLDLLEMVQVEAHQVEGLDREITRGATIEYVRVLDVARRGAVMAKGT